MLRQRDSLADKFLCSVYLENGADQESGSQAGQILWISDFQVLDVPDDITRSTKKFALYLTKQ